MTLEEFIELGKQDLLESVENKQKEKQSNLANAASVLVGINAGHTLDQDEGEERTREIELSSGLMLMVAHIKEFSDQNDFAQLAEDVAEVVLKALGLGVLVSRNANMASINERLMRQTSGLQERNARKREMIDKAKELATSLWNKDFTQSMRTGEVAFQIYDQLKTDYKDVVPEKVESVKEWIKPLAPDYAKKAGRPPQK
ncbi:MAG: hypothetical protein H6999_00050 [Hahellaceae bacterium]|nr:hypothetical protein [Hahellaceae bacterium]MCP5168142.1 hypothetical protein [Hahellaceae bacterium]